MHVCLSSWPASKRPKHSPNVDIGSGALPAAYNEDEVELSIRDDSVGLPADLDWRHQPGLGLRLVRSLVEKRLKGAIQAQQQRGAHFMVGFR